MNPAMLLAILESPDDDDLRLIYADWLEEHGDPVRGEFIRLQVQLHQHSPYRDEVCGCKWCEEARPVVEQLMRDHGERWSREAFIGFGRVPSQPVRLYRWIRGFWERIEDQPPKPIGPAALQREAESRERQRLREEIDYRLRAERRARMAREAEERRARAEAEREELERRNLVYRLMQIPAARRVLRGFDKMTVAQQDAVLRRLGGAT